MDLYSKRRLALLFGISRQTLEKYVDWDSIPGHPETAKNPKYSPYDVGKCLGYTRDRVKQIMVDQINNDKEAVQ